MKPTISGSSLTFDATKPYTVKCTYSGTAVYGIKILITKRSDNSIVYNNNNKVYSTRIPEITIPANTLINGNVYFIQLACVDSNGVVSEYSNKVYAHCYFTPTLSINITDGQKVATSTLEITANFSSSGNDNLKQCKFYLYSANGTTVLSESSDLYPTNNIQLYKFIGLNNNTTYCVRCVGLSTSGFELDTGLKSFYILQSNTQVYNNFFVKNKNGGIEYESNLILISPNESDENFEITDGFVDLTNKKLVYNSGFVIPDNFNILWIGKNFKTFPCEILNLVEREFVIKMCKLNGKIFAHLTVGHGKTVYSIFSNQLEYTDGDVIKMSVKSYNNYYSVRLRKGE